MGNHETHETHEKGAAAPQDDGKGATRLRKNANAKHVKHCMWVWLCHSFEFRSLRSLEFRVSQHFVLERIFPS